MTIQPIPVAGFPRPPYNVTSTKPLNYDDGNTHLKVLEGMRRWLINDLVPHIDRELAAAAENWDEQIVDLVSAVNDALEVQSGAVSDAINEWVKSNISANDSITQTLVNNSSETRTAIRQLIAVDVASNILASGSATQNAVDTRITGIASTIIENNPDVIAAAVSAVSNTAIDAALDDKYDSLASKVKPIDVAVSDEWRIIDNANRAALSVDNLGRTKIGSTIHNEGAPGYRITDKHGRVAFEVDENGRTHIYDAGGGIGGGGIGGANITTLHVFVCAGQSNMSGRGFPLEGPQSPRIKQFGAANRVIEDAPIVLDMVDGASGTSPALFFALHYLATQPAHVGVLLIPAARGGTMFRGTPEDKSDTWTWTNGAAADPEHALYERSVAQTLEAVTAAQDAGYHAIIKGVLWHQGEGNGGLATAVYAARLDALITDYRADLGAPNLPFMVGQMAPEGMEATPSKYTVDAAHRDTPARMPFTGFAAATRNGHNIGDTTHFSTVGTSHLGDTFAAAYIQALGNVHSNS